MIGEVPVKKKALLAALLAMTLLLSSCSLIVKDERKDAQSPILTLGDEVITKAQVQSAANNALYQMYLTYQNYGLNLDPTDPQIVATAQDNAIAALKQDMVRKAKAKELGLDQLTEEDTAHMQEHIEEEMETYRSYAQNYMLTDEQKALEGEELEAAIQSALEELGFSDEDLKEHVTEEIVNEKLHDYIVKDVAVTDEDVKADFDSKVAADEEKYKENAASWASADRNGTTLYYAPAGIRRIRQILIKFKAEDQAVIDEASQRFTDAGTKLNSIQATIADAEAVQANEEASPEDKEVAAQDLKDAQEQLAAAQDELKAAQEALDAAREAAFANLDEDADAVVAALAENPDSWDQLAEEKNEDPGMKAGAVNAEKGYAVFEGMADFDSAFVDAAMALESVGDTSGKVASNMYGYYILKYVGDVAEGAVDYDSVKDAIHDTLLSSKQTEVYNGTIEQWVADAKFKEDLGALKD